ncbi:MAG: hypothetical protein IE931_01175 [Sphingobacteriales bacterium]|nr:hypothetical protein [Sphingobacteriales bacterium]
MLIGSNTFAQAGAGLNPKRAKQIEAIKIGFITRRLDLSPEQSQKFWAVYNQYQNDLNDILRQKRQSRIANADNPDKLIDDDFAYDSKILKIKKDYRHKFSNILTPEQVKSLYLAEKDFRDELIKQLRNRAANRPQN